ncbi:MAG: DUF4380 domain-containing protein [Kiritimatiellia bacterium]|nr:DUF4380 domain-containing protein [Kiritimatiellia bacterium]
MKKILCCSPVWMCLILGLSGCLSTRRSRTGDLGDVSPPVRFTDTLVIENGMVRLAVAPSVGRIVEFGPVAGRNLLWLNTEGAVEELKKGTAWINYGGDKVWPAFQSMWARVLPTGGTFPPDPALDGSAWELIEQQPRRLVLRSPEAPQLGIRIVREIELHESDPVVVIRSTIERIAPSVFPVQVWAVSQALPAKYILMSVEQRFPQGPLGREEYAIWGKWSRDVVTENITSLPDRRAIRWDPRHSGGAKVGTLGTWCAAVYDDWVLVHRTSFDPEGSYPDASNIQVYADTLYVELETLGPQKHPRPGESIRQTVVWELIPTDNREDAELIEAIRMKNVFHPSSHGFILVEQT